MKKIMAIVNCTPDSFFDGGWGEEVKRAEKMWEEGADILDIGGESTRPGHTPISAEEEWERVAPVIRALKGKTLSIDTRKAKVAKRALEEGVSMLNDVSGFADPQMCALAAKWDVPIVLMHPSKGKSADILSFFRERIAMLDRFGVHKSHIILDPGIGFGKSVEDNLEILKNITKFKGLACPLLIALSRKSFMQRILNRTADAVLAPTLALNTMAMLEGVDYIRVHDVREHKEILTVLQRLEEV